MVPVLSSSVGAVGAEPMLGPAGVTMRLVTSAAASPGDVVPVEVWAEGLSGAAAFEVVATISPDAGRIVAVSTDEQLGRDDLSIGDATGFGVLAAFSRDGSAIAADGARLGTFDVRLDAEGVVGIALGEAMVVDAQGRELPMGELVPASIQVGSSSNPHPPAPMPWTLSPRDAGDDGLIDAAEIEMDWQSSRLERTPCANDIAAVAGGCLDIGDVQRVVVDGSARSATTGTREGPTRLTVTSRGDAPDAKVGDGVCATAAGRCSLRAAIEEANAITGKNVIAFALRGKAPYRIVTKKRLPAINDPSGATIVNGYTQPGATPNTARLKSNARILVEVRGAGAAAHDGFTIRTGGNVIRGLSIYAFRRPIWIFRTGADARGNRIYGNFIGTDPTGTYRERTRNDFAHGIHVEQGSPNTIIGGPRRAQRNVISGNAYHGIGLWHAATDGTVVRGNIIGLSPDGRRRLGNLQHGIDINFGVSGSVIGGRRVSQRNVISGNAFNGLEMSHRQSTRDNRIVGNFIGTRLAGRSIASWTGNRGSGIWIEDGASSNVIYRNVIGGNVGGGIRIINNGSNGVSSNNRIVLNRIGVSRKGHALAQGGSGVHIEGASNVVRSNVIAHHAEQGIAVIGPFARYNAFSRNRIVANGGLSIDLAPLGAVNPNDDGDGDSGPNAMLNFPVFTKVTSRSVEGTACARCRVEVFATGPAGASAPGHGPAARFLGAAIADADGRFTVTFAERPEGTWLSSTATNATRSTSEMSTNAQIVTG